MLLPRKWSDWKKATAAAAVFLSGVGLAFAAAVWWGVSLGFGCLFLGLTLATLMLIDDDDDKPSDYNY